ncbi:MAG: PDDEXK nuclease domain-containing protein [Kiritimatiellaeota bacterium]|nr:PDDEXK nuclease domain-containing protein [Kiritimatiellota bacterium]
MRKRLSLAVNAPKDTVQVSRATIPILASSFITDIRSLVVSARQSAYSAVSMVMLDTYWKIGRRIVEEEQNGHHRAGYGKRLIETLSEALTAEFGKGFSPAYLKDFRQFFLYFPDFQIRQSRLANLDCLPDSPIRQTCLANLDCSSDSQIRESRFSNLDCLPNSTIRQSRLSNLDCPPGLTIRQSRLSNLTWSHIHRLLRISDAKAREWYLQEAVSENWSVRTLDRNISSQYFHRLLASQRPDAVQKEMRGKTSEDRLDKLAFIKNPVVAEFLGLEQNTDFTESSLEKAILSHLQKFLMEMGKGFALVARQQHIRTDAGDYFIDLVFYNYLLKCFVLIDLKTTQISHQDVGQMDMYVRMFDDQRRSKDDNPTLGIILCSETSRDIARYSVLNGSKRLFASKYLTYLPSEEELKREIESQKEMFLLQHPELKVKDTKAEGRTTRKGKKGES